MGSTDCSSFEHRKHRDLTHPENGCTTAGIGSSVTGYRVWVSVEGGDFFSLAYPLQPAGLSAVGTPQSYVATDLLPGTSYVFKVTSVNPAGESAFSNEAGGGIKTRGPPPKPLVPPRAIVAAEESITVSWMKGADDGVPIQRYRLFARCAKL
jgi:hypothetical protein